MYRRVKKRFDINITVDGERVTKTFDLDKNITRILGLMMSADRDDLMYYRGEQKIEINREEIFPENYESKQLQCGINVPINQRYYSFGEGLEPGNLKVTVVYKDNSAVATSFDPYRVSLYLDCEITELER